MATLGNYYYDGTSFAMATGLWLDQQLLNPAPNGYYAQGGIYRQLTGGILSNAVACPSCIYNCGSAPLADNAGAFGNYIADVGVGNTQGAIVVKFTVGANSVAGCTWTYDGQSASEYSSPNFGYCEGIIGDENATALTNAAGSAGVQYNGTQYIYSQGAWVNNFPISMGPFSGAPSGGVTLTPGGGYGTVIMIIPKPNANPVNANFNIEMAPGGSNLWSLEVECPALLPSFTGNLTAGFPTHVAACTVSPPSPGLRYHYPVSGVPGIPAINDFVFQDPYGVTPIQDGFVRGQIAGVWNSLEIANGVIINITPC